MISGGSWLPESPRTQSLKGHQPASRPRASPRRSWAASRAVDEAVVEADEAVVAVVQVEFILEEGPESSEVTEEDVEPGPWPCPLPCSERPCCSCACRLEKVLPSSGR